jgi:beta-lactamase class A
LRRWLVASRTGQRRIRAGLPAGWQAGDKTGTCGTAVNDVAFIVSPGGREYMLAVYLDRPTVPAARAEAALADVGRLAARRILQAERR